MQPETASIEISAPKVFTAGAVAMVNAYGLLLTAPLLGSILVVSVMKFGVLTVLIPFLAVVGTTYFLPFGLGNTHVSRLVRARHPSAGKNGEGFIVQLTLCPRLRSGLRAVVEDADDIGYLSLSESGLRYEGDSVKLSVPFDRIEQVQPQNIGLRGLFVYGRRVRVRVRGTAELEAFEVAERSSLLLPSSRAITRKLYERLSERVAQEGK